MTIKVLIAFDLYALFNLEIKNPQDAWIRNPRLLKEAFGRLIALANEKNVALHFEIISRKENSLHYEEFKKQFENLKDKHLSRFHHIAIQQDALYIYDYHILKTHTIRYLAKKLSIPLQRCLFIDSNETSLSTAEMYGIETVSIASIKPKVIVPMSLSKQMPKSNASSTLFDKFNCIIAKAIEKEKEKEGIKSCIDLLNALPTEFNLMCLMEADNDATKARLPYFENQWRRQSGSESDAVPMNNITTNKPSTF